MTSRIRSLICTFMLAATVVFAAANPVAAQPRDFGPGWGPGMMMGPGVMLRGRNWCHPGIVGLGWRTGRLERMLDLTEAQKAQLKAFTDASEKAAKSLATSCPRDFPKALTSRFGAMENRMEAMLQAIRSIRPTLEAFYSSLSESQKAQLDEIGFGRRWRMPAWSGRN